MASVVGSPQRGPGTASPDAHGNTAESFSKKSFTVGSRSGEGGGVGRRRTRTPFRQFIPSDCFKSEEEQVHSARMSRWVRTEGNTGLRPPCVESITLVGSFASFACTLRTCVLKHRVLETIAYYGCPSSAAAGRNKAQMLYCIHLD